MNPEKDYTDEYITYLKRRIEDLETINTLNAELITELRDKIRVSETNDKIVYVPWIEWPKWEPYQIEPLIVTPWWDSTTVPNWTITINDSTTQDFTAKPFGVAEEQTDGDPDNMQNRIDYDAVLKTSFTVSC
jgi:hypothetical protein